MRDRRRTGGLRGAASVGALACLLTVSACAGSGDAQEPAAAATTGSPAGDGAVASPGGPPADAAATEPVASRTQTIHSSTVRADLLPLQRSEGALTVTLLLTVVDGDAVQLSNTLSDYDSSRGDTAFAAPDGITVVDGTNKQVHLTASDGAGACFCSPRDFGLTVRQPGDTVTVSALFAAPPADVTSVDVVVPTFGTFGDVAVG